MMNDENEDLTVPTLNRVERRVLGVLVEKALATPESYPMTVKALCAGCNQKSNRDPITRYDELEVEDALSSLAEKGLVSDAIGSTGRVLRYRQHLTTAWSLESTSLAVLAELLLRGAQSEGDLRARASRMRRIEGQPALRDILAQLAERVPPLVVRLSPAHVSRGVRWFHTLGAERDLEEARSAELVGSDVAPVEERAAAGSDVDWAERFRVLEDRVAELERWRAEQD